MSEAANVALIRRIADDIWNKGDLGVIDEIMGTEGRYHGPHMPDGCGGREDWRDAIARYRGAFPDSHVTYEDLIACGDHVVGRWTATGTQKGPMPGSPPSGRRIRISGITIYRFAEGKVVEAWEELDLLGMWRQLGVFTPPGH